MNKIFFQRNMPKHISKQERIHTSNKRFGDIPNEILGKIKDIPPIFFPSITTRFPLKNGNQIEFRKIEDIEKAAQTIADLYRKGIDEITDNDEYIWHHRPSEIIKKVKSGTHAVYGGYINNKLILVMSAAIIRGQKMLDWIWGTIDPQERGQNIWPLLGRYVDEVTQKSGAQIAMVWVVTTHPFSQQAAEAAGMQPWGIFPGGEYFGGTDGRYYRCSVVWYGKLYGDAAQRVLPWDKLHLTDKVKSLAEEIRKNWTEVPDTL